MVRRVLVTRPQPAASRTAERLAELGHIPVVLPLSRTTPLAVDAAAIPETIAAVAVTSANALRHAPPELLERLAELPCLAVGGKTAGTANDAGFAFVLEGPGDAESLAQTIVERRMSGPIVYLCGRVRRDMFEKRLAAAGIGVTAVETYDTSPLSPSPQTLLTLSGGKPVDAVLLYSVEAATAFLGLASRREYADLFKHTAFYCLSTRISDALAGQIRGKILVAAEPTEAALLSLISAAG